MQRFGKPIWVKTKRETILSKGKVYLEQAEGGDTVYNFISESYTNPNDKTILLTIIGKANAERALDWYQAGKRLRDDVVDLSYFDSREDKEDNDNLTTYGCLFVFFVFLFLIGMGLATLSVGPEPWQRWSIKIYVILNMSVLHIAIVAGIKESRKNPKRKTYKTKGIRYKIDKIERIIGTTFGMGLWIMIFCLDVWSIVSGSLYDPWSLYYIIRQLITIPIAVVWAFCVVLSWIEKADREERDKDG